MNKTVLYLLFFALTVSSYSLGNRENPEEVLANEIREEKVQKMELGETNSPMEDSTRFISADWNSSMNGDIVSVEGRIRLVGNDPFSELTINDAKGMQWYLDEAGQNIVKDYEQKTLRLRGIVKRKEMILANGKKLPDRIYLCDIELIVQPFFQ